MRVSCHSHPLQDLLTSFCRNFPSFLRNISRKSLASQGNLVSRPATRRPCPSSSFIHISATQISSSHLGQPTAYSLLQTGYRQLFLSSTFVETASSANSRIHGQRFFLEPPAGSRSSNDLDQLAFLIPTLQPSPSPQSSVARKRTLRSHGHKNQPTRCKREGPKIADPKIKTTTGSAYSIAPHSQITSQATTYRLLFNSQDFLYVFFFFFFSRLSFLQLHLPVV